MSDIFFTVTSGFLVFVLGQIAIIFIVKPIKNFKKVIGEIQHTIIYYANIFSPMFGDETKKDEASKKFRTLGAELISSMKVIPFYESFRLFGLPSNKKIREAHSALIGLSNSVGKIDKDRFKTIAEALDLEI